VPFSGLKVIFDRTSEVLAAVRTLTNTRVLVGVPAEKASRNGPILNSQLAYIHDNGAPEANIPARPFMKPGIKDVQNQIEEGLRKAGDLALGKGGAAAVERQFERIGTLASVAIKNKISAGIPPPLKESTLRARAARGRKGAKKELERRAQGQAASLEFAIPLIDTGAMRNSITYVVRKK